MPVHPHCLNCNKPLTEIFEGSRASYQFIDALHIQLHLGYNEFQDHGPDEPGNPQGCFCKECAIRLVGFFPGIQKLLSYL